MKQNEVKLKIIHNLFFFIIGILSLDQVRLGLQQINYKIIMINNEQIEDNFLQQKEYLLHWLQHETTSFNQNRFPDIVHVFTDVYDSKLVYKLLKRINYKYFMQTEIGSFNFQENQSLAEHIRKNKLIKLIQTYLQQVQCKRFSKYQKQLLQTNTQQAAKDITRLILYMAIKSQNKNEFVQRICNFSQQYQTNLMHQIMAIQNNLQNITEIQEIVNKFHQLNEQNSQLKNRLNQAQKYKNKITTILSEQIDCTLNLQEIMSAVNKEKMFIFQKLEFKTESHLLNSYNKMLMRYEKASKICEIKQNQQTQLYENHIELSNKKHNFDTVLTHLENQKQKLQNKYKHQKDESFNLSRRFSIKLQKQNKLKRQGQRNTFSSRYSNKFQDGDSTLVSNGSLNNSINMSMRGRNNSFGINQSIDLSTKLDQMTTQRQKMMNQLQDLKVQNIKLKKKQKKHSKVIDQLKQVYKGLQNYANIPVCY